MSSFICLRYINRSFKCLSTRKYCENLSNCNMNFKLGANNYATKSINDTPKPISSNIDEWRTMYYLPMVSFASAFNRLKISYGILNSVLIPAAFVLEQSSQLPPSSGVLAATVGVTSWLTLCICSLFTQNLIGIIYINDNNDKLKLAYVDYWGKRNDVCIDLDDIIPESEKNRPSKAAFLQSVCLYSDDKVKYKLLQRFGRIDDLKTFVSIFGE